MSDPLVPSPSRARGAPEGPPRRSRLAWLVRAGLGLGLVGWLVALAEPGEVLEALSGARPGPLLWAMGLFLGGVVFSALPWKLLLEPLRVELSWRHAVELSLMGFCVNNLVPGGLGGDALRAWAAASRSGRPAPAVASVLLDRWLAFVCLVGMAGSIAALYRHEIRAVGLMPATLGAVAALLTLLGVSVALFLVGRRWSGPWASRWSMGASVEGLWAALDQYRAHRARVAACLSLTLVTPLLDAYGFWLIGESLGLQVDLWPYLLMIPVLRVIHHLPVSVNAVGTQDAAVVFFWAAFGVGEPQALVMSLAAHALKILVALLSGLVWLVSWGGGAGAGRSQGADGVEL